MDTRKLSGNSKIITIILSLILKGLSLEYILKKKDSILLIDRLVKYIIGNSWIMKDDNYDDDDEC